MLVSNRLYGKVKRFAYMIGVITSLVLCWLLLTAFQSVEQNILPIERFNVEKARLFDPAKALKGGKSAFALEVEDIFYPLSVSNARSRRGFLTINAPTNDLPVMKGIHFVGVIQIYDNVKILLSDGSSVRSYRLGDTLSDKNMLRITEIRPDSIIVTDRKGNAYMISK